MSQKFKNRTSHIIISTLLFTAFLLLFCLLEYIDFSVITAIYLPVWIVGVVAISFGKLVFGEVILIFASLGLFVEYIIHILRQPYPDMSGSFLNTAILFLGFIAGIILQILSTRKNKMI